MKNKIIVALILILGLQPVYSQEKLSEDEKLFLSAKLYGFLKYYHPKVATGETNWDSAFLEILPTAIQATNTEDFSNTYLEWIKSLGEVDECKKCVENNKSHFNENFNLDWTQNSDYFTTDLSSVLRNIEKNRFQGGNHYITPMPAENFSITNEPEYSSGHVAENLRLLGLMKYWNIIEYYYPYKYLLDQNWDSVLKEMIPNLRKATEKETYFLALKELVAKVDDTHAWINLHEKDNWKYLPVSFKIIDGKAVVSSFYDNTLAQNDGFEKGDVILKIEGEELHQKVNNHFKYVAASNDNIKQVFAYDDFLNGEEERVELTIDRNGEIFSKKFNRYNFSDFKRTTSNSQAWEEKPDDIGYVNLELLENREVNSVMKKMKDLRAIIFDLRGYPKTTFYTISRYLNKEEVPFAKLIKPDFSYPGKFIWQSPEQTQKSKNAFEGKVIILVDEQTISLAEFAAMALQATKGSITIGSQTAGADGNVSIFEYLGGYRTAVSGLGVYYPDGTATQRVGIKLDIAIEPTIEGLIEGRDEILDKAIEIANQ